MKLRSVLILVLFCSSMMVLAESDDELEICEHSECSWIEQIVAREVLLAYPEPMVEHLEYDHEIANDRWYKRINDAVDIYDAPNGNYIRSIPAGFNFVTAYADEGGWTRINSNEWVQSDLLSDSNGTVSKLTGIFMPEDGLPFPVAWVLANTFPSDEPGAEPNDTRRAIRRYSLVNIFDTVEIDGFNWYLIGADTWIHQHHVGRVTPIDRPAEVDTRLWISIDLYEQTLIAYEGEQPIFATLIASGLGRWPTREGTFHIFLRFSRWQMDGGEPGDDFYSLEEVPFTMFFDEGRALHGAYWHDGFGYRRSHGCVNMTLMDSHWLYNWVADEMGEYWSTETEEGPAVHVWSSGEYT